ncbi:hypothetical protein ACLO87_15895 [Paenalcaligenes sp. Me52]
MSIVAPNVVNECGIVLIKSWLLTLKRHPAVSGIGDECCIGLINGCLH